MTFFPQIIEQDEDEPCICEENLNVKQIKVVIHRLFLILSRNINVKLVVLVFKETCLGTMNACALSANQTTTYINIY